MTKPVLSTFALFAPAFPLSGPRFGPTKLAAAATRGALTLAVLSALLLTAARVAQAQGEIVLYTFTGSPDGATPSSSLVRDGAGNLYGTTTYGGLENYGTVFELSPNGSGGWNETVLYSFTGGTDGGSPYSYVVFDTAGNLYGTAYSGGNNTCGVYAGCGVVFELSPAGTGWAETVLYSFTGGTDGALPMAGLIFDRAGNLYGTTTYANGVAGNGTVFELSPSGGGWTEQVIYSFSLGTFCSGVPGIYGLTMDAAGNIFGAACSIAFELSPNGNGGWTPAVIHTFTGFPNDGSAASGTPVLDKTGRRLYGTTYAGGKYIYYGTVYELSLGGDGEWAEKILYSFDWPRGGGGAGAFPWAGVVLDAAGNIYGTAYYGGEFGFGSVFELAARGRKEVTLWDFNATDGRGPRGGLILDSAGNLYGTTYGGGGETYPGNGVVFEVIMPTTTTTTALTSSPNPSTYGQAVAVTATVTSSTGTPPDGEIVTFEQGSTVLGTGTLSGGTATFFDSTLAAGTDPVKAVYVGDANFFTSTSNKISQVVLKAPTATALVSSQNPSIYWQPVVFTATVTPQFGGAPTGYVTFYIGSAKEGFTTALINGVAIADIAAGVGTDSITAEYKGSRSFDSSTSGAVSQVVNQASTTTYFGSSLNPSNFGQLVTFTARVVGQFGGEVTGSVTFLDGMTTLKTVPLYGGEAEYRTSKLSEGTHTITATYNGSTDFTGSSASLTQTVN